MQFRLFFFPNNALVFLPARDSRARARKTLKGYLHSRDHKPRTEERMVKTIGRTEEGKCDCGINQSAAHLLQWRMVGDGKGRIRKEVAKDSGWREQLHDFLSQ